MNLWGENLGQTIEILKNSLGQQWNTLNQLDSVVGFVVSLTTKSIVNKGWCAIQGSNLPKSSDFPANAQADAQIDAQATVPLGHDLSRIVTAWSKLPAALKAAILAIINSAEGVQ